MAKELPYLPTYKNVEELFKRIASAKQPDTFTTRFLSETLGLKATGDRPLITLLKALGFLDPGARPSPTYAALKNPSEAPRAIGLAIRRAYEPLYSANENAHTLPQQDLRGLVAQVAGTDSGITSKIAGTFNALVKLASFAPTPDAHGEEDGDSVEQGEDRDDDAELRLRRPPPLRHEFHYNLQIHLPSNATEETYLNIFNALRKSFS